MICPSCDSEDFYYGDLTGPNCANMHCENYKGGSVTLSEESEEIMEMIEEEVGESSSVGVEELDWDEHEEKTPVMGWTEPPELYLTEGQRTNYFPGFSRDSEATVVNSDDGSVIVYGNYEVRKLKPADNWSKYLDIEIQYW